MNRDELETAMEWLLTARVPPWWSNASVRVERARDGSCAVEVGSRGMSEPVWCARAMNRLVEEFSGEPWTVMECEYVPGNELVATYGVAAPSKEAFAVMGKEAQLSRQKGWRRTFVYAFEEEGVLTLAEEFLESSGMDEESQEFLATCGLPESGISEFIFEFERGIVPRVSEYSDYVTSRCSFAANYWRLGWLGGAVVCMDSTGGGRIVAVDVDGGSEVTVNSSIAKFAETALAVRREGSSPRKLLKLLERIDAVAVAEGAFWLDVVDSLRDI